MSVVSVMTVLLISVFGQTISASGALLKKNTYLSDEHTTARFGNNKVCGDHLCGPGEFDKLQDDINQAQISHTTAKNFTKTVPVIVTKPDLIFPPSPPPSTPAVPTIPIPTPSSVPYPVCNLVKATLVNSTISQDLIAKVMADLGCI